ncbi:MAG TPA: phenylalanine--tRNA ligase beta subunit-related protein [Solirubrobacteraceae bacterium]|jgi:DNA/RNA-binding domain of Phe-tRNA-synthetase-like protein|nr:phenylalanine--tRNA ligase beta subunit-related protein [Solirubrobacteraceae bacterium]
MSSAALPEPEAGWLASEVELELPGVRLLHCETAVGRSGALTGDSPADIEARLRELSNGVRGARAVGIRREPVPAAYRVFFRQVGMDPDVQRTPIEAAVVERMVRGGFATAGMLEDIRLIAMLDTGVPVWALDSDRVDGPLGIRVSRDGETLGAGKDPPLLSEGRLVVADSGGALAVLFGDLAPGHEPLAKTRRVTLFAIQVPGVPGLYAEEALWSCVNALQAP